MSKCYLIGNFVNVMKESKISLPHLGNYYFVCLFKDESQDFKCNQSLRTLRSSSLPVLLIGAEILAVVRTSETRQSSPTTTSRSRRGHRGLGDGDLPESQAGDGRAGLEPGPRCPVVAL